MHLTFGLTQKEVSLRQICNENEISKTAFESWVRKARSHGYIHCEQLNAEDALPKIWQDQRKENPLILRSLNINRGCVKILNYDTVPLMLEGIAVRVEGNSPVLSKRGHGYNQSRAHSSCAYKEVCVPSVQRVFWGEGRVWSILDFKDGGRLYDFDCMPLSFGYLNSIVANCRIKEVTCYLSTHFIIEYHEHFTTKQHVCFGCMTMTVNWQDCTGKENIDKSLSLSVKTFVQVEVHAHTG